MNRSRFGVVAALLFCAITASPVVASAQQPDKDADAERLFREGQKAMEERRFGDACPKFEAAYRKDQQLGTLLNLAYCHKEQGATWQAWLEFKDAELKAIELKRNDRKEFARQKMAELEKEKTLTRVVIDSTTKVELAEVLVEDHRVPEAEKGVTFAAEAGQQRKITFRAKGKKDKVLLVNLARSEKPQHVSVPDMVDETPTTSTLPPVIDTPPPPPHVDEKPKPPPPKETNDGSSLKTYAYILGGVAVVTSAVGAITGISAINSPCAHHKDCSSIAGARSSFNVNTLTSDIAFGVAGAALITGFILYMLAPSDKADAMTGDAHHRVSGEGQQTKAKAKAVSVTPEIGVGWVGFRGAFF